MELTELLAQGQKELEAEITRVLKAREAEEAARLATTMAYMAAVETTLHNALPECVWRYLDYSSIEPERRYFHVEVRLIVPDRAPVLVSICVNGGGGEFTPGRLMDPAFNVPWVASQMPGWAQEGGVEYYYTTDRGIHTNKLAYALAVAEQRRQEFDFETEKFQAGLVKLQLAHEAARRAKDEKAAKKAAELTAEEKLRAALEEMVHQVLDGALAERGR